MKGEELKPKIRAVKRKQINSSPIFKKKAKKIPILNFFKFDHKKGTSNVTQKNMFIGFEPHNKL